MPMENNTQDTSNQAHYKVSTQAQPIKLISGSDEQFSDGGEKNELFR
jgi:hypothetical protein